MGYFKGKQFKQDNILVTVSYYYALGSLIWPLNLSNLEGENKSIQLSWKLDETYKNQRRMALPAYAVTEKTLLSLVSN